VNDDVPLKEYLLALINAQREDLSRAIRDTQETAKAALAASEKAIEKAERANEKRFESVNEFRATLTDQAARFITRKDAWGYVIAGIMALAAVYEALKR